MNIAEIWEIQDVTDFIIAMYEHVCDKCLEGEGIGALTEPERVFFVVMALEGEVNNGGFSQYFYNSSGNFAGKAVKALNEIGAHRTAEICAKALSVFGGDVPTDWNERQERLDELDEEMLEETFEECDDAFYDYEDDLEALNYAYIMKHREQFT